ncbi:hypothetical protein KSS87_009916, partial [Heliosperma pusillum]
SQVAAMSTIRPTPSEDYQAEDRNFRRWSLVCTILGAIDGYRCVCVPFLFVKIFKFAFFTVFLRSLMDVYFPATFTQRYSGVEKDMGGGCEEKRESVFALHVLLLAWCFTLFMPMKSPVN